MLILIFFVFIAILFVVLGFKFEKTIFLIIIIIAGFVMLFIESIPTGDYTDWKKQKEIQLAQLNSDKENVKYLKNENNEYEFRYCYESEYKIEEVLDSVQKSENFLIEISYISNADESHIEVYERKGEFSIWTTTVKPTQIKYIFYIPEGTIIE